MPDITKDEPYCHRCERPFGKPESLSQHRLDSFAHQQCHHCDFDGHDHEQLLKHARGTGHTILPGHSDAVVKSESDDMMDDVLHDVATSEHDSVHDGQGDSKASNACGRTTDYCWSKQLRAYICLICEDTTETFKEMKQHLENHPKNSTECYYCLRKFNTYSKMIAHLESGFCSISIIELNEVAAKGRRSKDYLYQEYRMDMVRRMDLERLYTANVYPFFCACEFKFRKLSVLFSHIKNGECNEGLREGTCGRLVDLLARRFDIAG